MKREIAKQIINFQTMPNDERLRGETRGSSMRGANAAGTWSREDLDAVPSTPDSAAWRAGYETRWHVHRRSLTYDISAHRQKGVSRARGRLVTFPSVVLDRRPLSRNAFHRPRTSSTGAVEPVKHERGIRLITYTVEDFPVSRLSCCSFHQSHHSRERRRWGARRRGTRRRSRGAFTATASSTTRRSSSSTSERRWVGARDRSVTPVGRTNGRPFQPRAFNDRRRVSRAPMKR